MGGVPHAEDGDAAMEMVNDQVGGTPHEGASAGAMAGLGLGASVWND